MPHTSSWCLSSITTASLAFAYLAAFRTAWLGAAEISIAAHMPILREVLLRMYLRDTTNMTWLGSPLVNSCNSYAGGHKFNSRCWGNWLSYMHRYLCVNWHRRLWGLSLQWMDENPARIQIPLFMNESCWPTWICKDIVQNKISRA